MEVLLFDTYSDWLGGSVVFILRDLNIGHVTAHLNHLALATTVGLLMEFVGNDHILTHELVLFLNIPLE